MMSDRTSGPTTHEQRDGEHCLVGGREVAPDAGIWETYEAEQCHFCSPVCQARLEQDPERYLREIQDLLRPPGYS